MEYALQQQGFDYCYDKRLYDRLVHEGADSVHGHLTAETGYQDGLVRFIENHDEPRAAATFPPGRARAAAVATLSQTGARLVHEGQLDGRRVQLPVFLARRPDEAPDADLRAFYERLLGGLQGDVFRTGDWQLGGVQRLGGQRHLAEPRLLGLARRRPRQARRREPQRRAGLRTCVASVGRPGRPRVAARRHVIRRACYERAATTCEAGSTSHSTRGAGIFSI